MSREAVSKAVAGGIPGARVFPGGGLWFRRRDFETHVEFEKDFVDILIDTSEMAFDAVEVAPAGLWHDLRHMVGWRDTQVGDADFDRDYEIHSSHPAFAAAILTPEIRRLLRAAERQGPFYWRLSRAGFLLRVRPVPTMAFDLEARLAVAFQLLDALPGVHGRERMQVGPSRQTIDADTLCRICGTTLAQGKVVRCAKCATPHHGDCWVFNGRCAIFACGGTKC